LAQLEQEEETNERLALKKKEKKYRQKLSKLAEKENVTIEEIEARIQRQHDERLEYEQLQAEKRQLAEAEEELNRQR